MWPLNKSEASQQDLLPASADPGPLPCIPLVDGPWGLALSCPPSMPQEGAAPPALPQPSESLALNRFVDLKFELRFNSFCRLALADQSLILYWVPVCRAWILYLALLPNFIGVD